MGNGFDQQRPITRPEHAVVNLLEAVLAFDDAWHSGPIEKAFSRQPAGIREAIRRHWVVDHLPTYAMVAGISLSDFERELAERFWSEREAEYRPRRRRQEVAI